ncbi:MAG: nucleotidyl transferase AbiEii/AbiGii toxin family protein [Candidatus Omnitrophota bacterium]|nr:nucleotidyl transferase AbiEii/AbiGii toxin family protein [Candidatus Omnitrophota bacterium]
MERYNSLQLREVFHLEFLRRLGHAVKSENYTVKGGVNLRFFFKSFRYSEDMDIDVRGIGVIQLKETVMKMLNNSSFQENLKPFGIERIIPPNIIKAKQTETTQRFKVHLISSSGEDLFTKVEFSRRGFLGNPVVGMVEDSILRTYKLAPLLVPHYDGYSAVAQKFGALAARTVVQARDIFDLYILSSQHDIGGRRIDNIEPEIFQKAYERIFEVEFEQFRDTVVSYLSGEDQMVYNKPKSWEEIRLKVANFIEKARKPNA